MSVTNHEYVRLALLNLGGSANLSDIYSEVLNILKREGSNYKPSRATLRDAMHKFSRDVPSKWNGKVDKELFRQVAPGERTGKWKLLTTIEDDIQIIQNSPELTNTEKQREISVRMGQGRFRQDLIKKWRGCAVTGCKESSLLVASHIKPWRDSDNRERLDLNNGLLLIATIDKAFDNGLITFDGNGIIVISPHFKEYEVCGIKPDMVVAINSENKRYLSYHREHIFKST
ncbi:HNH endonuclease [Vibrio sp. NTOU-M3]|uniref:HNH endonuclease n=1 Tax=Vibrio sp. NTOU-M3 TaxID=3234954 RepID=UPI00349F9090